MSQSPTITTPAMTQAGMILGTAAYMSPEQARGLPVDKRADVWAFGVVLFEMLTGTRLFEGATVSDTLAFVITKNPDWTILPATTPAAVRRLLRRCLEKDRKRRMADAADVRLEIEEALTAPPTPEGVTAAATAPAPRGWLGGMAALAVATVLIIALGVPAVRHLLEKGPPASGSVQFTIPPPENARFGGPEAGGTGSATQLAVSPDGRYVVFVALGERGAQLWMRPLGAIAAQPLPGTEDATFPFWSPDSRFVAFFSPGKLKKIPAAGGPPVTLCDAVAGRGGSWSRDNVILFNSGGGLPLHRVSSAGGEAVAVSVLDAEYGESAHRWPQFLPDGRHFLYTAVVGTCCPAAKPARIKIGALDNTDTATLFEAESSVVYASGHLFFNRDGTLMAQPFDADARRLTGEAFLLAEHLASEGSRYASFSVSDTGVLLYANGLSQNGARRLTWVDRDGKTLGTLGEPGVYRSPRLSPDNQRVVVEIISRVQPAPDIWILDTDGRQTRLTFDEGPDNESVWSPDGVYVAFQGNRQGGQTMRRRLASGEGDEEELIKGGTKDRAPLNAMPSSWSPDGRFIAYTRSSVAQDVWVLPLFGDRQPFPFVQEAANETNAEFAPDGRWMAYDSTLSGQTDVYVRPFPPASGQFQISKGGGNQPRWRADGKELFFVDPGGTLMAVPIDTTRGFEVGVPRALFRRGVSGSIPGRYYDVAKDGKRFLVNRPLEEAAPTPITVVVNWPWLMTR